MANQCYYQMMVKGAKKDCLEWLNKMKDYNAPNHFYRMFDPIMPIIVRDSDDECVMGFSGYCAWSLATCCWAGGYSGGVDLFARNTRDLHLVMEAYSEEPEMGFLEHYQYDNGKCVLNVCVPYSPNSKSALPRSISGATSSRWNALPVWGKKRAN